MTIFFTSDPKSEKWDKMPVEFTYRWKHVLDETGYSEGGERTCRCMSVKDAEGLITQWTNAAKLTKLQGGEEWIYELKKVEAVSEKIVQYPKPEHVKDNKLAQAGAILDDVLQDKFDELSKILPNTWTAINKVRELLND